MLLKSLLPNIYRISMCDFDDSHLVACVCFSVCFSEQCVMDYSVCCVFVCVLTFNVFDYSKLVLHSVQIKLLLIKTVQTAHD